MKFVTPRNMGRMVGTRCRQSPLRGLVGSLILCAVLIGVVLLLQQQEFPWFVWAWCAAVAAVLVPWILADARAKFRPTNWLLRFGSSGLWINLRSYQNYHLPEAATVLHLPYTEIASARHHLETWSTPYEPSATTGTYWKEDSLELSLASGATGEIAQALADERGRRAVVKGRLDQKIARMALHWILHEAYSSEWRPRLTEEDQQAMAALIARLDAGRSSDSDLWYDRGGDALPLIRVAVDSFYRTIGPIPGEFQIITGLAPAVAESLLARLA